MGVRIADFEFLSDGLVLYIRGSCVPESGVDHGSEDAAWVRVASTRA